MNIIGEIGNFIMVYQEEIQIVCIAIFVIVSLLCIGKAVVDIVRKRNLLMQISETVSEINTNVKSLRDKRTEVIYIDGRATPEEETGVSTPLAEPQIMMKPETEAESPPSVEQTEEPEEVKPVMKYFSRDCAIAKNGRQYTVEELQAQIRD